MAREGPCGRFASDGHLFWEISYAQIGASDGAKASSQEQTGQPGNHSGVCLCTFPML